MNQQFSAKRQASKNSGTLWRRHTSAVARTFAIETGCPPPELFVMVSMTSGTRPAFSASTRSSRAVSMLPLNGARSDGSSPSRTTRSTASAPACSAFARVVSKCVLFGTTSPFVTTAWKRRFSAMRPWCVGITCR